MIGEGLGVRCWNGAVLGWVEVAAKRDAERYSSMFATLCDCLQSRLCNFSGFGEGAAAVNCRQIEVEFFQFAEQGAFVHAQLSSGLQPVPVVLL